MSLKKATLSNMKWSFIESISLKLVGFVLSIILARLLTPADFGVLAVVNVFYLLTNSFIDGGLRDALIQKKDASEDDYASVFWMNLIIAVLIYILLFLFAPLIEHFYDYTSLAKYIRIQSVCLIIDSLAIVQIVKSTKELNLKKITQSRIPSTIISFIVGITLAYLGYGIMALIVQQIIGSLLYFILLYYRVSYKPKFVIKLNSLKELYKFGLNLFFAGYLNRVYTQSMNLIYAKYYSVSILGLYNKSRNLQQLPTNIITETIIKGSYPTMVKLQDENEKVKKFYKGNAQITLILVALLSTLIFFQANNIIAILLGDKWLNMSPILKVIAVGGVFAPITNLNKNILKVKGKGRLFLKLEMLKKLISLIIIAILINQSFLTLIITLIVYESLFTFIDMYFAGRLINYSLTHQIQDLVWIVVAVTLCGYSSSYIVENLLHIQTPWFSLILYTIVLGVLFVTIMILFIKDKFLQELKFQLKPNKNEI